MAPVGSLFALELPKIFAGESTLISWFDIPVQTLSSADCPTRLLDHWVPILRSFFESGPTQLRSQKVPGFPRANGEGRKQFDSLTVPVNSPPSSEKHYDFAEIKNDAAWLSKEQDVDEEQALKVVLLEWQDRPKLNLQSGYAEAEIASLKDVYASRLAFDADSEAATFLIRDEAEFAKETSRRRRQIFIHFQECIGFARTWLALHDESLNKTLRGQNLGESSLADVVELALHQIQEFSQDPPIQDESEAEVTFVKQTGRLWYINEILQNMLPLIERTRFIPAEIIKKWFGCMADTQFLKGIDPSPLIPQDEILRLEYLITITSIALMQPVKTIDKLETSWLTDLDVVSEVQQILLNATDEKCMQAIPVAFVWSLILQDVRERGIFAKDRRDSPVANRGGDISSYDTATGRRSSIPGSTQQSIYEEIIDAVLAVSALPDPISTVIQHTIEYFHVAELLAAMLKTSRGLPFIQRLKGQVLQDVILVALNTLPDAYGPIVLEPQFAVLQPDEVDLEACNIFLQHQDLFEGILENAAVRFPHESYPFLKLCRILALASDSDKFDQSGDQYVTFRLKLLKSFTNLAVGEFEKYHTVHEDENANLVELDQHTYAFPHEVGLLTQAKDRSNTLIIPEDTEGEVISSSQPPVIRWKFEYSGLHLIGEWLRLYYNGALNEVLSPYEDSTSVANELIMLLTNLLTTTYASNFSNQDSVSLLLDEVSTNLGFGYGISDLIFNILEQELQSYKRTTGKTSDDNVLSSAVTFARAILKIQPLQFWRQIAKTSLASRGGLLSTIVSVINATSGDCSLATSVSELYADMIAASLKRPLSSQKSALYKNDERLYETVVLGFSQNMLEIYESISQWSSAGTRKQKIIITLSKSFATLVSLKRNLGSLSSRLTACLKSAADLVIESLRPESIGDAKSGPIVSHILESVCLQPTFSSDAISDECFGSLVHLSGILINVANEESSSISGLEHCLFDLAPVLVRYLQLQIVIEESYEISESFAASRLLHSLLNILSSNKPTSLLGHLGRNSSLNLINILAVSPPSQHFEAEAWNLLSQLINHDQQWLSVVILTGTIPDQKGQDHAARGEAVYRGKLLVNKALGLLAHIESLHSDLAQAVLQFMLTAQQNWSWTLTALRSRGDVFTTLVKFATSPSRHSLYIHKLLTARITDLCSVHLQYAKSIRDQNYTDSIAPLVAWLTMNAVDVNSYNSSLHTNLARNFQDKFGIALDDFVDRSTSFSTIRHYNTTIATIVLSQNPAWNPQTKAGRQSQSYASELDRANANLAVVKSELTLFKSFQHLLLEHSSYFAELETTRGILTHIAHRCLIANSSSNKKAPTQLKLYDDLLQSRAETALSLMQHLFRVRTTGSEVKELLKPAWESCLFSNSSYEAAIVNNDLIYWRISLSAVLVALQFHLGRSKSAWKPLASVVGQDQTIAATELLKHATNSYSQIVEIGRVIVGQGLDTIVSTILEERQAEMQRPPVTEGGASPSVSGVGLADLRLILHFLTTTLRHPQLPEFQAQFAQVLIGSGAVQSAFRLYAFSHLLATEDTGHDPVHGEIALRLLVSLSSLNECAEEMAIEGAISQMLTARITIALQRMPEGVSNLDARQHCACLYTLWSQGILPLVLNLLNAIGGPMVSEVSSFLNAFPNQLTRLSSAFRPRHEQGSGFITLSLAKEVSTLSLIKYVLDDYREAGASAAVDPSMIQPLIGFDDTKASLISDLKEHLALDKGVLRGKVVATTASEDSAGLKLVDQVLGELRSALTSLTNGEREI